MKNAKTFLEMYDILRHKSYLFNNLTDEPYCDRPTLMVDKTPRYIHQPYFEKILQKTPNVPVIVTTKTYIQTKEAWARRGGNVTKEWYDGVMNNLQKLTKRSKYRNRIMIVEDGEMTNDTSKVMERVFDFVGLEWKEEYLNMTGERQRMYFRLSYIFSFGAYLTLAVL